MEPTDQFGLLIVQCDIAGAKVVDGTVSVGTFNLVRERAVCSRKGSTRTGEGAGD